MSCDSYGSVVDAKPILVSGVYRSGTTFMAALLGAHPQLRAASSTIKFIRFCLGRYGNMCDPSNRRALVTDSAKRIATRWGLVFDSEAVLAAADSHDEPSYALMYDLMMRELLCKDDSHNIRWVEKLAVQWSGIPEFLDMFPNGRVVHILRDPRDVTTSYKLMTFEPGNTYLDAAFNCRSAMECMRDLDSQYQDKVFVLRAEDLANNPRELVSELWTFLDIDPDDAMFDAAKLHAEGEDWSTNTSHGRHFTGWPDGKPRWPEHLNRVEVMFIELITQPWLSIYNYNTSGFFPTIDEWNQIYSLLDDDFLRDRFAHWLATGRGAEGYRSDPYLHEMKIVFPERFPVDPE
jgi:hypothetical protein